MPLEVIRNDLTNMKVDAIVNSTDPTLTGSGGVDGFIRKKAGPKMLKACTFLGGCRVGEAKITKGYDLPCKYVIHTVGPQWIDGNHGEIELLKSCYLNSLELAKEKNCKTVAFPLISSGTYKFPKEKAFKTAFDTISAFLMENEMTVYIVVYDKKALLISEKLFSNIKEYIDDRYVDSSRFERTRRNLYLKPDASKGRKDNDVFEMVFQRAAPQASSMSLEDALSMLDESFTEMLLRKIDQSGMTDVQCYKKANIDRKLFSKIKSNKHYKPSKPTVIAFAVALKLSLEETKEFLQKAGFALSHSSKFDIIIEYFISHGNYNIYEINEALYAFDQSLLGTGMTFEENKFIF